ncbi:hypothetical protein GCM10010912_10840 [Paenibacillus albidus]|uniref:Immunity protein 22 n=1 Tax=Paenibacillus albidus TaxID=2041023 RepID=A0A917FD23_9BACL|nr:immunity 22 family protein [Paenibacillus albidus]GGF67680.1 hypothetical protein GCM10010912_10840 [Paenibacillus albidus]
MSGTEHLQKHQIHVWVGTYTGDDDTWSHYFDQDEYGADCGFCTDTGMEWFDYDFFAEYNAGEVLKVEDVLLEVPFSEQFEDELFAACLQYGVKRATHCVSLMDFDGSAKPGQAYNQLVYVGAFKAMA